MELTLKIPTEVWVRLETAAQDDACSVEEMAAHWLFISSRTNEELEEIEDEMDAANAERVLAQSDPAERKTLDDLREAIAQQRAAKQSPATNGVHSPPQSVLAA